MNRNARKITRILALAVALAMVIGMSAVSYAEKRVNECIKTGFKRVILPAKCVKACQKYADKIELVPVQYVGQMVKTLGLRAPQSTTPPTFGARENTEQNIPF